MRLVESGLVDTVQVIYNIFEQAPEDELFAAVRAADVGVIVRVPLDEGGLTGNVRPDTVFPDGDFRERYFAGDRKREVWERVQAIAADLDVTVERAARGRAPVLHLRPGHVHRDRRDADARARRGERARDRGGAAERRAARRAPRPPLGPRLLP